MTHSLLYRWGCLALLGCLVASPGLFAAITNPADLADVAANVGPNIEHCDEAVAERDFIEVFECGDELFEARFNALDGVGMDVGDGGRFTRVPRADLANWANTTPERATGPNAEACNICHLPETIGGAGDGAGPAGLNVIRDPFNSAHPGSFIQRNTPHLFGMAGPQLLAEEMNEDLEAIVAQAIHDACATNFPKVRSLKTKGINFGSVKVTPPCPHPTVDLDVEGVDSDLVVKPFQWKGSELTVRIFSRGAFHNELGMNPVEVAGDGVDGDFDSVVDEITIEDTTAMAVYLAGQPRPTSLLELDELRFTLGFFGIPGLRVADELGLPDLNFFERLAIRKGEDLFKGIGCTSCHVPSLKVRDPIFTEPSQNPNYREDVFPAGQNAVSRGVDPQDPVSFNITRDQPDNIVKVGQVVVRHLGAFEKDRSGRAIVRLYGDLKRHDMGPGLAENVDEVGTGASVWMTKELWGLANTAPYLHDGRATTIEEAILEHGGEAAAARQNFRALSQHDQDDVLAFLNNLVLFFPGEE